MTSKYYYRTWLCGKWSPDRYSPDLVVPEGKWWYVVPPGQDVSGPDIRWFATGREAIDHLQRIRARYKLFGKI